MKLDIVWLTEERTFAYLKKFGAHYSTVMYTREGIDYEVDIANDEWKWYQEWRFWPDDDGSTED